MNSAEKPFCWTLHEELYLFASLMLVTCFFLPWHITYTEQSLWNLMSIGSGPSIPLLLLFLLILVTPLSVQKSRVRPWMGVVTALSINAAVSLNTPMFGPSGYGASLARLFAFVLLLMSARPVASCASDLVARRLNSRNAEGLSHWGTVVPALQFSAQEFYSKLENDIQSRHWPGVELVRVLSSEAGLLSHKREYLRIVRQRQVVDVCAAPFGDDYFFTVREAEIQGEITLASIIILIVALILMLTWLVGRLGLISGILTFSTFLVFAVFFLFNVLRMGLTRFDGILIRTPIIGPIYERWFRRSTTYFQHDTRIVFLKIMDDLVKEYVDAETSAKGITHLSCFEHQPIFEGLYNVKTRILKPRSPNKEHGTN